MAPADRWGAFEPGRREVASKRRYYDPSATFLGLPLLEARSPPGALPGRGWSRRWRWIEVALLILVGPPNARRDVVIGSPMKARASRIAMEASSHFTRKKRARGCGLAVGMCERRKKIRRPMDEGGIGCALAQCRFSASSRARGSFHPTRAEPRGPRVSPVAALFMY